MSNLALYVTAVLIWGSTFFAIEFQLGTVAPEVSIVYRYVGASALLFAWSRWRELRLSFGWREHAWFVLLGMMLFGINYILAYRAQIYITSALNAIAFSSIIWMNIINARLLFGMRAGRRTLIGAGLGIAGIIVLFAPQIKDVALTDAVFFGSVLAFLGALCASFGNMVSQAAQKRKLPVVQSNAWGMFYGALLCAIYALVAGYEFNFEVSGDYIISLVYLTVFGSIFAFGAYLTLLGRIGATKAAYAMVMFPVVAVILSALFEGLTLDSSVIAGTALVLGGNLLVLRAREKPAGAAEPVQDTA